MSSFMKPNFLIIGAMKAGTTSLYYYLNQHPEVFMSPVKEPHFFAFEGQTINFRGPRDQEIMQQMCVTERGAYEALFRGVKDEKAVGEASAMYLYYPESAERIKKYNPDMKLIVILRNPVDRAYSSYMHLVRDGREYISDFESALREEPRRIAENWVPIWHYQKAGFYYLQLKRYLDVFPKNQIKIYIYEEDLKLRPQQTMRDIFLFLEVDEDYIPNMEVLYNLSGIPKNRKLHNFLIYSNPIKSLLRLFFPANVRKKVINSIKNKNLQKGPPLSEDVRKKLMEIYSDDIRLLGSLLGKDLSIWLKK